MQKSIAAAQSPLCAHVFKQTFFDEMRWTVAEKPTTAPFGGLGYLRQGFV